MIDRRWFPQFWFASLLLVWLAAPPASAAEALPDLTPAEAEKVSYRRDVWPIIRRHCWGCHSDMKQEGGLNLSSVADMLHGGDSGPLLVPGKPDASLLVKMIIGDEPEMPQESPPLSIAKIQVLRHWVLAGGKDDSQPGDRQTKVVIPATYRHAPAVTSVALDPSGKLLAAACRSEVVLISLAELLPSAESAESADPNAADKPGDKPASQPADASPLSAPRRIATESDLLTHVEFSPNGEQLAAVGGAPSQFGLVQFFNPADGKLIAARKSGFDTLFRGSFHPDGQQLAVGGADGAIHVIPIDPQQPIRRFELHSDWVNDVAYSPTGKLLISGSRDKAVKVSSVETGELIRSMGTAAELISAVGSSEKLALSAGRDRTLLGYEYSVALTAPELQGKGGNGARPVDRRAQSKRPFENQAGEVYDLATNANGQLLAVCGAGADVRVYNTETRARVALITGVPAPIYSVALNAEGTLLALGSASGLVQVYEIPSGKLLKSLSPVPVQAAEPAGEK